MSPTVLSTGINEIREILTTLNNEGQFALSVLTDGEGLPIAAASKDGVDPERHSANVAMIQNTINSLVSRIGLAKLGEIAINDVEGRKLVCKPIYLEGKHLILAILLPKKATRYRKLLNQASSRIKLVWDKNWQ